MCSVAYASVYQFVQAAVQRTQNPNMPASESAAVDATTEEGKKQMKAKKANSITIANLTMAFTTDALMGLVHKATTVEWPSGMAKWNGQVEWPSGMAKWYGQVD
jgi:hypothetical protein